MDKPKRKTKQQNFLNYLLNEFIFFRRDFTFVTHLSPEETAENLQHLTYEKKSFWWRQRRIKVETVANRNEISFEVKAEQPQKMRYAQSAKASGTIFADDDGATVIEGAVSMGGLQYWLGVVFVIGYLIFVYWSIQSSPEQTPPEALIMMPIFFGGILVFLWLRMYRDRNYLASIIEQSVSAEKAKSGI
jgi:hypothetical protein